MPHSTAVICVVGLSRSLIGDHSPRIQAFARSGQVHTLAPPLPAVTCTVQASMLTGLPVREHGIVGNGWFDRELAEVHFWKQSNRLVQGEKVWDTARRRDPSVTCGNLFWWFNMYSSADYAVTPRPQYRADGRKIPDVYSQPADLRDHLQSELGRFPLFNFWGPMSSIVSSRWIADAAMIVHGRHAPTLTLIYLPHLDYALQKVGPGHVDIPAAVREVDSVAGDLIDYFQQRGVRVMIVSEYGIEAVEEAVHINQALRQEGALRVRDESGGELLDAGASDAFAVADHQVAHVYIRDQSQVSRYARLCREVGGVEQVLDREGQRRLHIDHARAGDLVLIAEPRRWFSYQYWLEDHRAPDFARTVDIHRKPGYDPLELFIDPTLAAPRVRIALKLLRRRLGFRGLLNVIPLDARLVRGSHGRVHQPEAHQPLMIAQAGRVQAAAQLPSSAVRDAILGHLFDA